MKSEGWEVKIICCILYCKKILFSSYFLQRWFFSGHFDPVLTWGFNPGGKVSEHLKVTFVK